MREAEQTSLMGGHESAMHGTQVKNKRQGNISGSMTTVALNSAEGKWIMSSAILASAMAFIDGTALNVVLPSLQQSLHASGTDLFWKLNAYLLMLAALILIGGALG